MNLFCRFGDCNSEAPLGYRFALLMKILDTNLLVWRMGKIEASLDVYGKACWFEKFLVAQYDSSAFEPSRQGAIWIRLSKKPELHTRALCGLVRPALR